MYKKKVLILPLIIQDDTLTIGTCGVKTQNMNIMINTCANIMGIQFGSDKCVKLHIGKNHNPEICGKGQVDVWKQEFTKTENNDKLPIDMHNSKLKLKQLMRRNILDRSS